MKFVIQDWAGNTCFKGKKFDSFEDAWDYLYTLPEYEGLSDKAFHEVMSEYQVFDISLKEYAAMEGK